MANAGSVSSLIHKAKTLRSFMMRGLTFNTRHGCVARAILACPEKQIPPRKRFISLKSPTMLFLLLFAIVPIAMWIWHPLWMAHQRRWFWWVSGITMLFSILPMALIGIVRSTNIPYTLIAWLQVPSGWIFASIGMSMLLACVRDIAAWLTRWLLGSQKASIWWQPRLTVIAVGCALLLCGYGGVQGLQTPEVREQHVVFPQLPPELDGLRVAVLADIHASPVNNSRYVQTLVERTNAARPDLVLLPGDLVDGDVQTQAINIAPLGQLRATYGVWAAPGNHEYYSGYDAWAREYAVNRLHYLANETRVLDIRGQRLAISGVGDPAYGRLSRQNSDPQQPEGVPPDIAIVVQQAQAGKAQFHILMGHQPKMARHYAAQGGVDVQIAGHTHGGHIIGMDRWLVAPANQGFVRGWYTVASSRDASDAQPMRLFVSNGAGLWSGFTVRLGVLPSIDMLVLRSRP